MWQTKNTETIDVWNNEWNELEKSAPSMECELVVLTFEQRLYTYEWANLWK